MVEDSSHVYQPAEDTYLLLRAALKEARPEDCSIEIGCGRAKIASTLAPAVKSILATDINPYAVKMARAHGIEAIRTDLFRGIDAKFDLVVFNPPYLPTSEEEKLEGWLNRAFDGGESGRETICRFLEELRARLNEGGRALLLVSSLSGLEEVKRKARDEGFDSRELSEEGHFFERLYVLKITHQDISDHKKSDNFFANNKYSINIE